MVTRRGQRHKRITDCGFSIRECYGRWRITLPMTRIIAIDCLVEKPFVFDVSRFRYVTQSYIINNEIHFPPSTTYKNLNRTYRTRVSWSFGHSGMIYEHTNHNTRLALRRYLSLPFLDVPGRCLIYRANGAAFIAANRDIFIGYSSFFRDVASISSYNMTEAAFRYADEPHAKRRLRLETMSEIFTHGYHCKVDWAKCNARVKMKRDEWAKPGAYPRAIGDLGVARSMQGGSYIKACKIFLTCNPLELANGTAEFVMTPSPVLLKDVFDKLLSTNGKKFYMAAHSDDSCVCIRLPGQNFIFNLDISSCDSSHSSSLFIMLRDMFADGSDTFQLLINHCRTRLDIFSVDMLLKTSIEMLDYCLLSGSVLTTLINSIANFMIFLSICQNDCNTANDVVRAASLVGYVVTIEQCFIPEDIQFLKHSPVQDVNGLYHPVLNAGVVLRALGICKGDVVGSKNTPLFERGLIHQRELVRGLVPYISCPFADSLRHKLGVQLSEKCTSKQALSHLPYGMEHDERIIFCSNEQYFRRYVSRHHTNMGRYDAISMPHIEELMENILLARNSDIIFCEASNVILEVDYKLGIHNL